MNITQKDLWWFCKHHPLLASGWSAESVEGILEVSAYYDGEVGRIFSDRHLTLRSHHNFVADRFAIRIEFDADKITEWPKVYETGFRSRRIARLHGIPVEDLHCYPTGEVCLGFPYPWDPAFTLEYFLAEIVEPFFYRLAYVDLYGLAAARRDLWSEYSHGLMGLIEHRKDVQRGLGPGQFSQSGNKRSRAPGSRHWPRRSRRWDKSSLHMR